MVARGPWIVFLLGLTSAIVSSTVLENLAAEVTNLKNIQASLARQVMLQQMFIEETNRGDGDSGLKAIREAYVGTKPYFSESFTPSIGAIHDHTNYDRTVGMGELEVVLNGVNFRTRHNDYQLRMPSKTKTDFGAVDDIPFPEVPPEVLSKRSTSEQIQEMREWFKAWKNQDYRLRDYRKYFKAVLCYLEGGWTTNTKSLEEPFQSDRHFIDASSWFDLQEKVRFTAYTGSKSSQENFAYLPTTIMNIHNGTPEFAQWNYRIACHPLGDDLPLNSLILVDDIAARFAQKQTLEQFQHSRSARFYLTDRKYAKGQSFNDRPYMHGLLDDLMNKIPGKDNYMGNITDDTFGAKAYNFRHRESPLNTAFYHRYFATKEKDAMGTQNRKRGFNDQQLFVALTNQPQIAPMSVKNCRYERREIINNGRKQFRLERVCRTQQERVTYAIPLEVIYLTPLYRWNPYNLEHNGASVTLGGRNGGLTEQTAYNGTNSRYFYFTPSEFFGEREVNRNPADTTKGVAGVLDRNGDVKKVVASGTRIHLPGIPGVGRLRTRFPIMPVYDEGSATFKELKALEDMVMNHKTYSHLFPQ